MTLVREDGTPTYHLASVVDDVDFGITHVIRGNDHRPNEALHRRLFEALGATPPEFVHHGLILGEDGKKLSKRAEGATVASLREAGIRRGRAAYLEELGLPKHDVHYDLPRIRRLAIEAIGAMSDGELAERAGAPVELAPSLRGARDLNEARDYARSILEPEPVELPEASRPTLERFAELLGANAEAHALIRELKAVGGDLKTVRLALTGRERGPELWADRPGASARGGPSPRPAQPAAALAEDLAVRLGCPAPGEVLDRALASGSAEVGAKRRGPRRSSRAPPRANRDRRGSRECRSLRRPRSRGCRRRLSRPRGDRRPLPRPRGSRKAPPRSTGRRRRPLPHSEPELVVRDPGSKCTRGRISGGRAAWRRSRYPAR